MTNRADFWGVLAVVGVAAGAGLAFYLWAPEVPTFAGPDDDGGEDEGEEEDEDGGDDGDDEGEARA